MIKAKFIVGGSALLCLGLLGKDYVFNGVNADEVLFEYDGDKTYKAYGNTTMSKGTIHYYSYNSALCNR